MEYNNTIKLHKFSTRNNDLITVYDNKLMSDIPDLSHYINVKVAKLTKKAIYTQLTTEELKEINKIINQILTERAKNGN